MVTFLLTVLTFSSFPYSYKTTIYCPAGTQEESIEGCEEHPTEEAVWGCEWEQGHSAEQGLKLKDTQDLNMVQYNKHPTLQ